MVKKIKLDAQLTVENVTSRLLDELEIIILDTVYSEYSPDFYDRTYELVRKGVL